MIIYINYLTIQSRPPPVLSVLAAINLLVLPVLPYEDTSSVDDYFDHLQSAIMVTCIIPHMSSDHIYIENEHGQLLYNDITEDTFCYSS